MVLRNLFRRRGRTFLTLFGIAIGVAAVVALGAMANHPALLLADKPTGNLDSQSGAEVVSLMRELNRDLGTTVIIVTHDPSVARRADRILLMRDGRIVKEMTNEEMTNEPMNQCTNDQ